MSNLPETTGIELEGVAFPRGGMDDFYERFGKYVHSITTDASVESVRVEMTPRISLFMGDRLARSWINLSPNGYGDRLESTVIGYEVVSKPLLKPAVEDFLMRGISYLYSCGEIPSPRSSIHIHKGFPDGLIFLKGALAIGMRFEPLLYKIAGMGAAYRGHINESAYARPLSLGVAAPLRNGRFAMIKPEMALSARDIYEFWRRFGIHLGSSINRYTPLRYFGVNIFSVLLRGTLEFRHFNATTRPRFATAVSSLCGMLADLSVRASLKDIEDVEQVSLTTQNSDMIYENLFGSLLRLSHKYRLDPISGKDTKSILRLIQESSQPVFSHLPIRTHLPRYVMESNDFDLEEVPDARHPGTVDIHNFSDVNTTMILKS